MATECDHPPADRAHTIHRWVAKLLGMDLERRHEIYATVASSATLRDGAYWLEILFSAGIATLGLILNSPAVIIGAMLISPLMGPILANALALAAGDLVLSLRAMTSLLISALLAVSFATLLVVLLPFREMTAEIAARTQPSTLDLVIALFSGAVGSIAICKNVRGVATSIPGVAIAVALMPPLCVVGYGVGLIVTQDRVQGVAVVRGGGLLFLTNLVAITFMAMIVFLIFHVDGDQVRERVRVARGANGARDLIGRIPLPRALSTIGSLPGRLILVVAFIAILVVPLGRSFDSMKQEISQRQFENRLQKRTTQLWQESFARTTSGEVRSYIDTLSASEASGRLNLHLRIFTSKPYSHEERAEFLRRLAGLLDRPANSIDLSLVEIPTSRYEVAARSKSDEIAPPVAPAPLTTANILADLRARVESSLATVPLPEPATLDGHVLRLTADDAQLEVTYVSPRDIDADGQALLSNLFRQAIDDPSLLVVLRRVRNEATVSRAHGSGSLSGIEAEAMRQLASLAVRHPTWPVVINAPAGAGREGIWLDAIRAPLTAGGVLPARISVLASGTASDYRVTVAPPPPAPPPVS